MCFNWKNSFWMILTGTLMLLILIGLGTAFMPGRGLLLSAAADSGYAFCFVLPELVKPVYFVTIFIGWALAFSMFRFLIVPGQTDFYFSIGMKRSRLFFSRLLIGIAGMGLAVFIPMTISLICNLVRFGLYPGMLICWLFVSFGLMLQGMVAYLFTVLGMTLAGTLAEVIIYDAMLIFGFSGMTYGITELLLHMIWDYNRVSTLYLGSIPAHKLMEQVSNFNPAVFFLKRMTEASVFYTDTQLSDPVNFTVKIFVLWGAALFVCGCLCIVALNARAGEQAGRMGVRIQITRIAIYISEFCTFVLGYVLLHPVNRILGIAGGFAAAFVIYVLWQRIFLKQHPGRWVLISRMIFMMVGVAILLLVTFFCGRAMKASTEKMQNKTSDAQIVIVSQASADGSAKMDYVRKYP